MRDALSLFPIVQGNNVAFENLGEHAFFRILETIPSNGALIATSDTDIQIKEYYFLENDKKSDETEENQVPVYADEEFTEEEFIQIKTDFES